MLPSGNNQDFHNRQQHARQIDLERSEELLDAEAQSREVHLIGGTAERPTDGAGRMSSLEPSQVCSSVSLDLSCSSSRLGEDETRTATNISAARPDSNNNNNDINIINNDTSPNRPDSSFRDMNSAATQVGGSIGQLDDDRSPAPDGTLIQRHPVLHSATSTNTQTTNTTYDDEQPSLMWALGKPGLLYCSREPLKLKNFRMEVRAAMDVEQFCYQAELLLDLSETSMVGIVETMLAKVVENENEISSEQLAQIRDSIFIPGSAALLARTIQGYYSIGGTSHKGAASNSSASHHHAKSTRLSYDQSWLCALCNLSQVSKRHMVFARFRQPVNMGESAHEVRLFCLIIVPAKEKSTKGQVETGRTFATMLADAQLRHRLLQARDELEFKALMMVKAQQMAQTHHMKNRYKYRLGPVIRESISSESLRDSVSSRVLTPSGVVKLVRGTETISKTSLVSASGDVVGVGGGCGGSDGGGGGGQVDETFDCSATKTDGLKARQTGMFHKNPRTSKLFELITLGSELPAGDKGENQATNQAREFIFMGAGANLKQADKVRRHLNLSDGKQHQQAGGGGSGGGGGGGGHHRTSGDAGNDSDGFLKRSGMEFARGLYDDFRRRLRVYPSDFRDAFVGPPRTLQKTVATIWFLYFGILLPTIAFSSLNTVQTHGHMGDLRKAIIGQAIGGLGFALLGGQPLVIIMTTAPLCLYTKVIHQMCLDYDLPFPAMYAAVGLWNGLFLVLYSLFGFSQLMKWCTRSTEEVFALFIVVAFVTDAGKDLMKNFRRFYFAPACEAQNARTTNVLTNASQTMVEVVVRGEASDERGGGNGGGGGGGSGELHAYRDIEEEIESSVCRRETSLLFVLLMLGTLWLAITLYKFRRTPYLSAGKRDALADYALPTAVIIMSLVGSTIFDNIYVEKFPPLVDIHFEPARLDLLPWSGVFTSMGLGFMLSLLFFMDQNISAAMVMAPQNRLKKGSAYHYDLLIVGLLNGCLTLYGLPMMHGVLPHSPLHARSLADIEERIEEGHLREVVVHSRETRVTSIVAHVMVLLSLLLIPYPIAYIPRAVLNGLFLYMAVTSLDGLQVFERILLLVTEQSKYPPNHYIRRCPQRKIHQFTLVQLGQLAVMCLFGFSPVTVIEMFFPIFILLMIPFRHRIIPKLIGDKFLDSLDGKH